MRFPGPRGVHRSRGGSGIPRGRCLLASRSPVRRRMGRSAHCRAAPKREDLPVIMDAEARKVRVITAQASKGKLSLAGLQGGYASSPMFMRCDPARLAYADRRWEWAFSSFDSCYLWAMQDERR